MTRQYLRRVRLTLGSGGGGITIENLEIVFAVERTLSAKPNLTSLAIANLKKEHRAKIAEEWKDITLEAGYEGNVGIIFKGKTREVEHVRERPDIWTKIEAGDGDEVVRRGVVSEVLPAGKTVKDAVELLHKKMPGIAKGEWKGFDNLPAFTRAVVMHGPVGREMDSLSRMGNFYWSIQNETLETVPSAGAFSQTVEISEDTGMIGAPTLTESGVKVKCLLNPQLAPGRQIKVKSSYLDETSGGAGEATFRINTVKFSGDSIGDQDFVAEIEGQKLEEGKPKGLDDSEKRGS